MENGMNIALEEKARVDSLIRKCFPDVDDFEQCVSYTLAVQPNRKSFWSRIVRVFLQWNNEKLSSRYPKSIFVKIPHVSENVGNSDKSGVDNSAADAETLLILTKFEILWYERFGADTIPYFPMPKFYAAETVTESGTGIIAMEDLSERVKAMDLIPGFSFAQVERLVDALAGFHYHFMSKKDQSWVNDFDRTAEIDPQFQYLQFDTALKFESICPEKFAGRIKRMEEYFSVESGLNAHYSYKELDVPPVLVHFDLNPTNVLWSPNSKMNELVAIIDFQLLHTGNFAEDIVRVLMVSLSRHDRCLMTKKFLKRYHDTLTQLFSGNPPFTLDKVYAAYDRIFLYACNFGLFGLSIYHDMYEELEKDEVRRAKIKNELIDRAYGIVLEAERLLPLRRA